MHLVGKSQWWGALSQRPRSLSQADEDRRGCWSSSDRLTSSTRSARARATRERMVPVGQSQTRPPRRRRGRAPG